MDRPVRTHRINPEEGNLPMHDQPTNPPPAPPGQPWPTHKPRSKGRTAIVVIGSVVAGLLLIGSLADGSAAPTPAPEPKVEAPAPTAPAPEADEPAVPETTEEPAPEPAPKPDFSTEQREAIEAAQSYLESGNFSRHGLIEQLSSEYGEGFSKSIAVFAVNHISVDWNEQAAKAAKSYLETGHFSRSGLIEQLESEYGEGFTHSQAVYGVNAAGL
jgi:Host cell surface-exposed lipoprotein